MKIEVFEANKDLLPCPFCGSEDLDIYKDDLNRQWEERQENLTNKVLKMFEFCGCGNPDEFVEGLRQYLIICKLRYDDRVPEEYKLNIDTAAYRPYEYLADKAGLTEHGSSVTYAWITDEGEKLLKELNKTFYEFTQEEETGE